MENLTSEGILFLLSLSVFVAAMFIKDYMFLKDRKELLAVISKLTVDNSLLSQGKEK